MNERFRLLGKQAVDEKFLLKLAAFFEWHLRRGFHGTDGGNRREQTALFFSSCLSRDEKIRTLSATFPSFSSRSRVLGAGLPATSQANAIAPARRSPSMRRSTMPNFSASSALTGLPLVQHFDGFCDAGEPRKAAACPPRRG